MDEMDVDAPAGTKRKADDISDESRPVRRIKVNSHSSKPRFVFVTRKDDN
jgi:hypothetical protein